MMTNIGLMGGTFDPPHLGHIAIAEEARRLFHSSEVVFVLAGHPYFKSIAHISAAEHRVKMLELALAPTPYFKVSLMEIERPGPTYTVDTILRLKEKLGAGHDIYFILGWDSLLSLPRWQDPARLINLCRLVAAPRPGYPVPGVTLLEKDLPGISQRVTVMEQPLLDISSSDIRERVRRGLPFEHMVPWAVAEYIREQGLYLN
jgi:nicotinate-nucleotide adenylyltransferase